jgi:hypothetical protein
MNQFGNPDGQDFKLSGGARYVLGSQKLEYNIKRQWFYVCLFVQYSSSSTHEAARTHNPVFLSEKQGCFCLVHDIPLKGVHVLVSQLFHIMGSLFWSRFLGA